MGCRKPPGNINSWACCHVSICQTPPCNAHFKHMPKYLLLLYIYPDLNTSQIHNFQNHLWHPIAWMAIKQALCDDVCSGVFNCMHAQMWYCDHCTAYKWRLNKHKFGFYRPLCQFSRLHYAAATPVLTLSVTFLKSRGLYMTSNNATPARLHNSITKWLSNSTSSIPCKFLW